MNRLNVLITKRADKDESKIFEYIAKEFGETYAVVFRKKLIELFHTLSKHPLMEGLLKKMHHLEWLFIINKIKIVYKVTESDIIIIRILNTKTNLSHNF
ncbi:MAG: ParE toxin of type toxin-antitoxin system, parDE [Segetibacter sp.]|nr:ParE toxin of type toxin-antitoxin system, parDE [Segetibacter sp.]